MSDEIVLTLEQQQAVNKIIDWRHSHPYSKQTFALGGLAGCLSGSTKVAYNRGSRISSRLITMEDLHLKFNGMRGSGRGQSQVWDPDLTTYLTSLWPDGTVSNNEVVGVFQSGEKQVIRIDFDNGSHLILTEDHPISVSATEYLEAGRLPIGSTVLAKGSMKPTHANGKRPIANRSERVIINTRYYPNGSVKIVECNGVAYRYKRVHRARLVYEANINNVSYEEFVDALKNDPILSASFVYLDKQMDVHHRDENPMNDELSNLEAISHANHAAHHASEENFHKEYTKEVKVVSVQSSHMEMTYDIQMESPANNFCANGIFVHNTGKSTMMNFIRGALNNVGVCAPTGKAAHNLRGKGIKDATTMHALMYHSETIKGKVVFTRKASIPFSTVLVDEASMVGTTEMNDLLSYNVPIVWFGDHGQLEPVGENPWLMKNPDVKLEKIHRQAEGNPIIRLAMAFREGRDGAVWDSMRNGVWESKCGRCKVIQKRYMADHVDDTMQIICGMNATRHRINKEIRTKLGYNRIVTEGDKLICLRNNSEYNTFNGQLLFVLAVDWVRNNHARVWLGTEDGDQVVATILTSQLGANVDVNHKDKKIMLCDYGYAITCHKAQGSGFSDVAVIEECGRSWDLSRWRYTAVTRAAENLVYCI